MTADGCVLSIGPAGLVCALAELTAYAEDVAAGRGPIPVWDIHGCALVLTVHSHGAGTTATRTPDLDFERCVDDSDRDPIDEPAATSIDSAALHFARVPSEGGRPTAVANERGFAEFSGGQGRSSTPVEWLWGAGSEGRHLRWSAGDVKSEGGAQ